MTARVRPSRPEAGAPPALVLVSRRSEHPLWDPTALTLIAALEDRDDAFSGRHVTWACHTGAGPRLEDAIRAVRFIGVDRIVVVTEPGPGTLDPEALEALDGSTPSQVRVIPASGWTVEDIERAYREGDSALVERVCA